MSISSWFFGKKKSPTSPPDVSMGNVPATDGDDFIFVEKKNNQDPNSGDGLRPMSSSNMYPPLLPYSIGSNTGPPPESPSTHNNHMHRQDSVAAPHMLVSVPFKISPKLDSDHFEHLREFSTRSNDVLFQISQIDMNAYVYDFAVEKSVLREVELGLGSEDFE